MANNTDYGDMISGIMSDPAAMNNVLKIARNLMGSGDSPAGDKNPAQAGDQPDTGEGGNSQREGLGALPFALSSAFSDKEAAANRERLLVALKPYLNSDRGSMVETIVKLLRLAKIADIGKLLGNI